MDGHGHEVVPGLHRIEAPLGERFVACYVIVGSDAALLYDTGVDETPAGSIAPYLESAGIDPTAVRTIVVSHNDVDHLGGNAAAKSLFPNASLLAHAADRGLIEDVERIIEERYREFRDAHDIDIEDGMIAWCRDVTRTAPIDIVIDGPTHIELGGRTVQVLPTPGHSHGSISLWDETAGAAIVSDAVLGDGLHFSDGRPAFPPTYRYPTPYRDTVDRLLQLDPTWLLTAHEPVMEGAAGLDFLRLSRSFADRLEARAVDLLAAADAPMTTLEMIDRLAPEMGEWEEGVWVFLANELVGHLEDMESSGIVARDASKPVGWSLKEASA